MSRKLPAFQFYPGDWLKDPDLRRCSPAARGVWMDMLCLMFECEDRGVLSLGGSPWLDQEIAAAISGDTELILQCVRELLAKGVAHRDANGAIFSRRLVRDQQTRTLTAIRVKNHRNGRVTHSVTPVKRPCTEDEDEGVSGFDFGVAFDSKEKGVPKTAAEHIYRNYPRHEGHRKALEAIAKAIVRLSAADKVSPQYAARVIAQAVEEYAHSPAGHRGRYTPHCATWMNQDRFLDDRKEWYRSDEEGGNGRSETTQTKWQQRAKELTERTIARLSRGTGGEAGTPDGTDGE